MSDNQGGNQPNDQVTGIGGFFFRGDDPKALGEWYRDNLGIGSYPNIWQQQAGPTVVQPFARDSDYFGRAEQQWMLNLRVRDLDGLIAKLKANNIAIETRDEWDSGGIGRFARIHDPEGNPIELWEPVPD